MTETSHHLPYARWAHVLLRLVASALLMQHGVQKLFGLLGATMVPPVGSLFWFAGIIETVGGLLVFLGLFTRVAAFIVSGELAVAYFKSHFPNGFWPIMNKGELAVILCFTFLYFAATGAGALSFDYIMSRRKTGPTLA